MEVLSRNQIRAIRLARGVAVALIPALIAGDPGVVGIAVQRIAAEIVAGAGVVGVSTGLRHDVDDTALSPTIFRVEAVRDDLDLLDGIEIHVRASSTSRRVGD